MSMCQNAAHLYCGTPLNQNMQHTIDRGDYLGESLENYEVC